MPARPPTATFLVSGPEGAGKSRLITQLRAALGSRVVEGPPDAEPMATAEAWLAEDDGRDGLVLVTVLDAARFVARWDDADEAELLAAQIEVANVVVLDDLERAAPAAVAAIESRVLLLNPGARVVRSGRGELGPAALAELTSLPATDLDETAASAAWVRALRGEGPGFVFRARRPFHPERLWALLHREDGLFRAVVRSKGFFWLATRNEESGLWAQAGASASFEPAGAWYAALPEGERPEDAAEDWEEPFGDRRQEIAFLGEGLEAARLAAALDACLLTDAELATPERWTALSDPFPAWLEDHDDGCPCCH